MQQHSPNPYHLKPYPTQNPFKDSDRFAVEILENISDGFLKLDAQWRALYVNQKAEQLLQYDRQALLDKSLKTELCDRLSGFCTDLEAALATADSQIFEACYPYGHQWLEVRIHPTPEGILLFLNDITDRKSALHARNHREKLYRTLVKNFPNGAVFLFDRELRFSVAEGKDLQGMNLSKHEVEGKTLWEILPLEICEILEPLYQKALAGETSVREIAYGKRIYLTQILPIQNDRAEVVAGMVMTQNITDRKRTEEENSRLIASLQESEAKMRSMASLLSEAEKLAHVGCWELEIENDRLTWSDEVFRIFGLEATKKPPLYSEYLLHIHPDDRPVVQQVIERAIAEAQPYEMDLRIQRSDGSIRYVSANGEPIFGEAGRVVKLLGSILDITDRHLAQQALKQSEAQLEQRAKELEQTLYELQRTQTQLIQTERMSGLGQLVAGIAHEVNNPVSFIYGNIVHASSYIEDLVKLVHLYQKHYPNPDAKIETEIEAIDLEFLFEDLPKLIKSMKVGAERIREIVRSLRNFARLDEAEIKPVNIHEGIESTLLILQNRFRPDRSDRGNRTPIQIVKNYGELPLLDCYPSQLNQVFLNVINNALDALDSVGIEEKNVRGEGVSTNSPNSSPTIEIRTHYEGHRIAIHIADNGPGVTEEIKQKMFDPFFTTKPVGTGTGLGLSISYQIVVEKHKGELTCISEPGKGTEVVIYLPVGQEYREPALFE